MVEPGQLRGGEHTFVDDGARRQRREVDSIFAVFSPELALAALADEKHDPVQRDSFEQLAIALCRDEDLLKVRHGLISHGAQLRGIRRHRAPT